MRTLLMVLLLATAGCDKLWEPYIASYDTAATKEAFPKVLENSYKLSRQYMLMATGNFDGDREGVTDVAVSGVFTGSSSLNPSTAASVPVEIYTGDGLGGLKLDGTCLDSPAQRPVFLLTVPVPGGSEANDILVATEDSNVYLCSKSTGTWTSRAVKTFGGIFNGFKRLALAYQEPPGSLPDLAVRTGINQFTDSSSTTGSLHVYRADSFLSFGKARVELSTGGINWVLPYRVSGAPGDSLATTWDNVSAHPGIEFHYLTSNDVNMNQGAGQTGAANVPGTAFPELKRVPFAALAPLRTISRADGIPRTSILFTYSQDANSVAVLYGQTVGEFSIQAQQSELLPGGFMLPYAGDADGDMNDEIGLYTMAPSGSTLTRHLLIFSYKTESISIMNPIVDIALPSENFRAMALEYLGNRDDLRKQKKRKDLIALVEDPINGSSRLLVRRPDLSSRLP